MAHVVRISNPLLSNTLSLKREFAVDYDVLHSKISESDVSVLSPTLEPNQCLAKTNNKTYIPLKIEVNQNTAFISALITGDKTVFGSMAVDELSHRV